MNDKTLIKNITTKIFLKFRFAKSEKIEKLFFFPNYKIKF